ncbi:MAG: phosphoadenosine phosphosulfate reductase family protein [Spirochaetaceae bacterium]|nr:phosphoadenosine phosphosulfate reductase family protein [Spirochaetaceae bacterium]
MAHMREALESLADPSIRHIVPVSGGKDSAALAIYMAQTYPQIPTEYVFCDTDAELPETYDYLDRLEAMLGKPINRINALDYMSVARKPSRKAFDFVLNELYSGFLPSPQARWCTRKLKIEPFERYVGTDKALSYIGIRADEDRYGYVPKKPPVISDRPNITPVYPFKDDGLDLGAVKELLQASGIGFPEYYRWRSRSGCYFCFYQQIGEWQRLKEHHPALFESAKGFERSSKPSRYTWVQGRSLVDIEEISDRYPLQSMDEVDGCAVCHL